MRARGPRGSVVARLGLTRQVALLSLLPIVALGFILAHAAGAGEPIAAENESDAVLSRSRTS
jgi:hypothetical protein